MRANPEIHGAEDPRADRELTSRRVLGIPLALTDYEQTLDWIDATSGAGSRGYICVAAVHTVMAAQEDPELHDAVLGRELHRARRPAARVGAERARPPLSERVYGPELMERACERAARTGRASTSTGAVTTAPWPSSPAACACATRACGSSAATARHSARSRRRGGRVAVEINRSGADVVWVGVGVPKQEKWMARLRDRLDAPVLVGVGAAFDFHAGLVPQAPAGLQRLGLEWAFRLLHEPRRLWRRYLRYNPRFVLGFARQYGRHLRGR